MASIKVLLWDKPNKEELYPIAIRIIKDRKPSYIYIGQYLKKAQWDTAKSKVKKNHPNSVRINNLILSKLAEFNNKMLDLEVHHNDTSSKAIKKNVTETFKGGFAAQAEMYLDNLKQSGKYNRISAEAPRINRFKEFVGGDIVFKEITVPLLNKFRAFLKGTRNVSERTIINHLVIIRSIFNQAIKGHVVDVKYYPFGHDKIHIKFPDSMKIGLVPAEIKTLEDLDLSSDPRLNHARNLWLFSFYFAGMRVSDVLRLSWSEIHDGRLYYAMGKNGKIDSLKMPEKALKIVEQYKDDKDETDLVFPELKSFENLDDRYHVQMRIKTKVASLNLYLSKVQEMAGLTKAITMHIPRHSFGNISGDKIPIQMLQRLYRHTDIKTTIGYQSNFIHKDVDDALNAVLGL